MFHLNRLKNKQEILRAVITDADFHRKSVTEKRLTGLAKVNKQTNQFQTLIHRFRKKIIKKKLLNRFSKFQLQNKLE